MMKTVSLLLLTLLFFPLVANAEKTVVAGRYAVVSAEATESQRDILQLITQVTFSENVSTVGDALNSLLQRSGYQLAVAENSDPLLPVLLTRPLPHIHRHLGPLSLANALQVLASDVWLMVVDPVHRLISFELKPEYRFDREPFDDSQQSSQQEGV